MYSKNVGEGHWGMMNGVEELTAPQGGMAKRPEVAPPPSKY